MPRFAIAALLLVVAFAGCGQEVIENDYGRQRMPGDVGSVNGTDVLASMFEEAGHEVHTRRTLVTDEMTAADTVVWFPNDTSAPKKEVCEWFDEWLVDSPGRTLIFVGRDFDAEPQYWDFHYGRKARGDKAVEGDSAKGDAAKEDGVKDKADDDKAAAEGSTAKEKTTKKDGESDGESDSQDTADPDSAKSDDDESNDDESDEEDKKSPDCRWFTYEPGEAVTVRELTGPWADGIDAQKARLEVGTRLIPKGDHEVLLDSEAGPIVSRLTPPYSDGSQIILVENGSFLLNLALINHEHRKLAGELVAAAGEGGSVVFLESGPGGPPIDPPPTDSSLWTLFQGWPLGAILLQLSVAGILFCFARWPIFGRPKQPAGAATTDFSYHVAAVGELLGKTRDPQLTAPTEAPAPAAKPAATKQAVAKPATTAPQKSSSMFR